MTANPGGNAKREVVSDLRVALSEEGNEYGLVDLDVLDKSPEIVEPIALFLKSKLP